MVDEFDFTFDTEFDQVGAGAYSAELNIGPVPSVVVQRYVVGNSTDADIATIGDIEAEIAGDPNKELIVGTDLDGNYVTVNEYDVRREAKKYKITYYANSLDAYIKNQAQSGSATPLAPETFQELTVNDILTAILTDPVWGGGAFVTAAKFVLPPGGIPGGDIYAGPVDFDGVTITDAIQQLVDLEGNSIWYVDYLVGPGGNILFTNNLVFTKRGDVGGDKAYAVPGTAHGVWAGKAGGTLNVVQGKQLSRTDEKASVIVTDDNGTGYKFQAGGPAYWYYPRKPAVVVNEQGDFPIPIDKLLLFKSVLDDEVFDNAKWTASTRDFDIGGNIIEGIVNVNILNPGYIANPAYSSGNFSYPAGKKYANVPFRIDERMLSHPNLHFGLDPTFSYPPILIRSVEVQLGDPQYGPKISELTTLENTILGRVPQSAVLGILHGQDFGGNLRDRSADQIQASNKFGRPKLVIHEADEQTTGIKTTFAQLWFIFEPINGLGMAGAGNEVLDSDGTLRFTFDQSTLLLSFCDWSSRARLFYDTLDLVYARNIVGTEDCLTLGYTTGEVYEVTVGEALTGAWTVPGVDENYLWLHATITKPMPEAVAGPNAPDGPFNKVVKRDFQQHNVKFNASSTPGYAVPPATPRDDTADMQFIADNLALGPADDTDSEGFYEVFPGNGDIKLGEFSNGGNITQIKHQFSPYFATTFNINAQTDIDNIIADRLRKIEKVDPNVRSASAEFAKLGRRPGAITSAGDQSRTGAYTTEDSLGGGPGDTPTPEDSEPNVKIKAARKGAITGIGHSTGSIQTEGRIAAKLGLRHSKSLNRWFAGGVSISQDPPSPDTYNFTSNISTPIFKGPNDPFTNIQTDSDAVGWSHNIFDVIKIAETGGLPDAASQGNQFADLRFRARLNVIAGIGTIPGAGGARYGGDRLEVRDALANASSAGQYFGLLIDQPTMGTGETGPAASVGKLNAVISDDLFFVAKHNVNNDAAVPTTHRTASLGSIDEGVDMSVLNTLLSVGMDYTNPTIGRQGYFKLDFNAGNFGALNRPYPFGSAGLTWLKSEPDAGIWMSPFEPEPTTGVIFSIRSGQSLVGGQAGGRGELTFTSAIAGVSHPDFLFDLGERTLDGLNQWRLTIDHTTGFRIIDSSGPYGYLARIFRGGASTYANKTVIRAGDNSVYSGIDQAGGFMATADGQSAGFMGPLGQFDVNVTGGPSEGDIVTLEFTLKDTFEGTSVLSQLNNQGDWPGGVKTVEFKVGSGGGGTSGPPDPLECNSIWWCACGTGNLVQVATATTGGSITPPLAAGVPVFPGDITPPSGLAVSSYNITADPAIFDPDRFFRVGICDQATQARGMQYHQAGTAGILYEFDLFQHDNALAPEGLDIRFKHLGNRLTLTQDYFSYSMSSTAPDATGARDLVVEDSRIFIRTNDSNTPPINTASILLRSHAYVSGPLIALSATPPDAVTQSMNLVIEPTSIEMTNKPANAVLPDIPYGGQVKIDGNVGTAPKITLNSVGLGASLLIEADSQGPGFKIIQNFGIDPYKFHISSLGGATAVTSGSDGVTADSGGFIATNNTVPFGPIGEFNVNVTEQPAEGDLVTLEFSLRDTFDNDTVLSALNRGQDDWSDGVKAVSFKVGSGGGSTGPGESLDCDSIWFCACGTGSFQGVTASTTGVIPAHAASSTPAVTAPIGFAVSQYPNTGGPFNSDRFFRVGFCENGGANLRGLQYHTSDAASELYQFDVFQHDNAFAPEGLDIRFKYGTNRLTVNQDIFSYSMSEFQPGSTGKRDLIVEDQRVRMYSSTGPTSTSYAEVLVRGPEYGSTPLIKLASVSGIGSFNPLNLSIVPEQIRITNQLAGGSFGSAITLDGDSNTAANFDIQVVGNDAIFWMIADNTLGLRILKVGLSNPYDFNFSAAGGRSILYSGYDGVTKKSGGFVAYSNAESFGPLGQFDVSIIDQPSTGDTVTLEFSLKDTLDSTSVLSPANRAGTWAGPGGTGTKQITFRVGEGQGTGGTTLDCTAIWECACSGGVMAGVTNFPGGGLIGSTPNYNAPSGFAVSQYFTGGGAHDPARMFRVGICSDIGLQYNALDASTPDAYQLSIFQHDDSDAQQGLRMRMKASCELIINSSKFDYNISNPTVDADRKLLLDSGIIWLNVGPITATGDDSGHAFSLLRTFESSGSPQINHKVVSTNSSKTLQSLINENQIKISNVGTAGSGGIINLIQGDGIGTTSQLKLQVSGGDNRGGLILIEDQAISATGTAIAFESQQTAVDKINFYVDSSSLRWSKTTGGGDQRHFDVNENFLHDSAVVTGAGIPRVLHVYGLDSRLGPLGSIDTDGTSIVTSEGTSPAQLNLAFKDTINGTSLGSGSTLYTVTKDFTIFGCDDTWICLEDFFTSLGADTGTGSPEDIKAGAETAAAETKQKADDAYTQGISTSLKLTILEGEVTDKNQVLSGGQPGASSGRYFDTNAGQNVLSRSYTTDIISASFRGSYSESVGGSGAGDVVESERSYSAVPPVGPILDPPVVDEGGDPIDIPVFTTPLVGPDPADPLPSTIPLLKRFTSMPSRWTFSGGALVKTLPNIKTTDHEILRDFGLLEGGMVSGFQGYTEDSDLPSTNPKRIGYDKNINIKNPLIYAQSTPFHEIDAAGRLNILAHGYMFPTAIHPDGDIDILKNSPREGPHVNVGGTMGLVFAAFKEILGLTVTPNYLLGRKAFGYACWDESDNQWIANSYGIFGAEEDTSPNPYPCLKYSDAEFKPITGGWLGHIANAVDRVQNTSAELTGLFPGGGGSYVIQDTSLEQACLALDAATALKTERYNEVIGDGVTRVFVINHALGSRGVVVSVWRNVAPYDEVIATVEHTDINNVTVRFAPAPATNSINVTVIGI